VIKRTESLILLATLFFMGWGWDYQPGEFQRIGRIKILILGAVCLAAVKISKQWHWSIGLFYLYISAVFLHQGMPGYSVIEIIMVTVTLFLVPEVSKRIDRQMFTNIVLCVAAIHCAFGTMNLFHVYPMIPNLRMYHPGRPIGLLGQPTVLAAYLAFALPFAIKGKHYVFSALIVALTILTQSTMGMLSLVAVGLVYVLFYRGFWEALGVCIIGTLGCVLFDTFFPEFNLSSFSGRSEPWADAWSLWKQSPIIGYGIGSWSEAANQIGKLRGYERIWIQVHNEYLQGLFEVGLAGMSFIGFYLLRFFGRVHMLYLFRDKTLVPYIAGAAALLVNSIGNFPIHLVPHGFLLAYCIYQCSNSQQVE
jgi:O-antigen ligase